MENENAIFNPERFADTADSLLMVDWPEHLTDIELAFCRHHASGKQPTNAYMAAQKDACVVVNKMSASRCAGLLLRRAEVVKYIEELRKAMIKHCVAKGAEMMAYLSAAIFTPISEIDDDSPLCTKKIVTERTDKDGATTTTTVYETVNKLESLRQLSRMQGLDAPIQIDHNHSGGVMLMPFTTDLDKWSKSIADQQKNLMDDAINV